MRDSVPIGVLLYTPGTDKLFIRFRKDWHWVLDEADAEILAMLADDMAAKATEMGPLSLIEWLEGNLSNSVLISERHELDCEGDPIRELDQIYRAFVRE